MSNQSLLKVMNSNGNFDLTPYLRTYQVEYADLDASTETCASGKTVRDFLRTRISIKCTLRATNSSEMTQIMNIAEQKELTVAYYNAKTATYSEEEQTLLKVFPSTTRSLSVYTASNGISYQELSLDFTEF